MRESLGKIAELPLSDGVIFLRQQAEIISHPEQPLEQLSRLLSATDEMQAGGHPKRTRQKYAFASGQAVHVFFFGPVTENKTIFIQLATDRLNCISNALVRNREKIGKWHREQGRIQSFAAI